MQGGAVPPSAGSDLWVSWDAYHRAIEKLALLVHASHWKFDVVLCLARGGLRPGDVFSRVFDVPLAILSTSSYRAEAGRLQGELHLSSHISLVGGTLSGNVLVVDDLADSGVTLSRVQNHLKSEFPAVSDVRTAVIWCKGSSAVTPDYFLEYLPSNPWIHQPFEAYDGLRPDQLAERSGKNT